MLRDLRYRFRALFRRDAVETELDEELRFHIDEQAKKLERTGLNRREALRRARLQFGANQAVREECRDARGTQWIEDLRQDLRYGFRALAQRPGFSAVALLTLALGIGATTVVFTVINSVLLKPLPFPHADRLLAIHHRTDQYGEQFGISYPDFLDLKQQTRSLSAMTAWINGGGTISESGPAERVDGLQISADFFRVYGLPLPQGREFSAAEDRRGGPPVAIISHSLWQRRFNGSPQIIGTRLTFEGATYSIIGVAPENFQVTAPVDIYTPIGQNPERRMQFRQARMLRVQARLAPTSTMAAVQAELALISRNLAKQYPKENQGNTTLAVPLQREWVGDVRSTLWLLLGAVGLVLLIACVNVASLLLARAVSRDRELAMRVALGARRGRLVRQCLTESALLAVCGGLLGAVLAYASIGPFVTYWPGALPRVNEIHLDIWALAFTFAISLLTGILAGLAPALRAPVSEVEQTLRKGGRAITGSSRRLHSGFVAIQLALAVVLLVAAGILGQTMIRLAQLDPGIDPHNVLVARVAVPPAIFETPAKTRATWREFLKTTQSTPGTQSAAISDIIPMRAGINGLPYWNTPTLPPPDKMPTALTSTVSPDYWRTMGIPLRSGRLLNEQDSMGTEQVIVIDEVLAAHAFKDRSAVGEHLWVPALGRAPVRVVGVVGHVRYWGLASDDQSQIRDQIYCAFDQTPDHLLRLFSGFMSLAVRSNAIRSGPNPLTPNPLILAEPLRRALSPSGHTLYDIHAMEQLASASLARQRFLLTLFGIFSAVALLLACIGIYGVLAYLNGQRIPEFGVRMALGASARDVMRLVLRESVGMILLGLTLGAAGALAASRLLQQLVEGVHSTDPTTFAAMLTLLAGAALLASFLPALRASRTAPTAALRNE